MSKTISIIKTLLKMRRLFYFIRNCYVLTRRYAGISDNTMFNKGGIGCSVTLLFWRNTMTQYIYPQNLRAKANLWLWSLRDFFIMGIAALLSVVILVQTHIFLPAAATLLYAFLSIRLDDTTIIDYLRYAVKFFISTQQYFEWR